MISSLGQNDYDISTTQLQPFTQLSLGEFNQQREKNLLGLQNGNRFAPCSISLSPWRLKSTQFNQAISVARSLSQLFCQVSEDQIFLQEMLADYNDSTSLLYHLKKTLNDQSTRRAKGLNLSRQDLLLDINGQWRLVESNAIAAGMGPFSEKLGHLLSTPTNIQAKNDASKLAPNPAIESLAASLYSAALQNNVKSAPLVLMVVAPDENNIHDQNCVIDRLRHLNVRVVRRTFAELAVMLKSKGSQLHLKNFGRVDVVYYRTGYNLRDYSVVNSPVNYLSLRQWIEEHELTVAPSINQQIAASKWIQAKLSRLQPEDLEHQFLLDRKNAQNAFAALESRFIFPGELSQVNRYLETGNWILKSQNEGGGNVFDHTALPPLIDYSREQWLLMEKIQSQLRREGVAILHKDHCITLNQVVSELGIFTLGDAHQYGGYLLRSKPFGQLETGVHQAGGFLDSVRLVD